MNHSILIVDDEQTLRWSLGEALKDSYRVIEAEDGPGGLQRIAEEEPDLVLLDGRLPGLSGIEVLEQARAAGYDGQVIMMTAYGEAENALRAGQLGAFDYVTKPFTLEKLKQRVENALEAGRLRRANAHWEETQKRGDPFTGFIGRSPRMEELFEKIRKIGASQASTVLIQGESGAGKELVARAIHRATAGASGPVVEINCAAIPETLLESELFGHEKGAFTDAKSRKKGLIEAAAGGTLFLDEIGEMGLQLQARLLRVLENRTFRRVGGIEDLQVKARIVAATNKDLMEEASAGRFRSDLYFRLGVIVLEVPPLRERTEDIGPLANFFIARFNRELGKSVAPVDEHVLALLEGYGWPGNIRELKNLIERVLLLEGDGALKPAHLPAAIRQGQQGGEAAGVRRAESGPFRPEPISAVELRHIERTLEHTGGNKSRAAQLLGISRQTLREKLKQKDVPSAAAKSAGASG
ncbi:MAG: sigma-54 dependent transcriptional regulator [Candidatus Krumholzibacteriia bacterium]|nr:sigma-54-dependent Fis family transcriptional regulator [bacterium]MCB9515211.1 sigma-54-dependent Fis family transcriptional regulator [Candidatus Latescibacterota bacterium]